MKISASIYSNSDQELTDIIKEIDKHAVDFIHIDCNDNYEVFDDIKQIREFTAKPIDLHIISSEPEKFYDLIEEVKPEFVTFQYENISGKLDIPEAITSELGLAITTETSLDVFDDYADKFSFIMLMATTPGQSSGVFNKTNFKRIRSFRKKYPAKEIHVDGGVNGEVSFILRNIGVSAAVSGSFLFKNDIGSALLDLKLNITESSYRVKDFMIPPEEIHIIKPENCTFTNILKSIEKNRLGFTIITDESKKLKGIVTNADVRKGLLKNIQDFNKIKVEDVINFNPVRVNENFTVKKLLKFIKVQKFPINYLPVVNDENQASGALIFYDLIKGE